ncbi:MAG: NAD(P)/FAD-dependent oxidoreductase [Clostridia bacterium]|nr:NAD(P)/FAD-dependent oxidoreductase [Clostridia bacterium]
MKNNYDVIVIGAGNGGLAAAAYCAKAGLKTLLLEKHNLPGGSASSFVRGRFEFEPSLHELSGSGTPEDPSASAKLFNDLGAKVDFCSHSETYRLIVPAAEDDPEGFIGENGVRVKVDAAMPSGFEEFSRKLDSLVPGSYESSMKVFRLSSLMYESFGELGKGKINPVKFLSKYGDVLKMASHTLKECLDELGMPEKAQGIFTAYWCYMGAPPRRFDFLYYMAMMHGYIERGVSMPRLRSHEMSCAVDKAIRDFGGEIRYNSEVTRVLMQNGKPCGVEVNGKTKLFADYFICNTHPNFALADFFSPEEVPADAKRKANGRPVAATLITVYLGMNRTKEQLGIHDYSLFIAPSDDSDEQFRSVQNKINTDYVIINCLNEVIPDCSPEGTSMLFLTGITYGDVMKGVKPEDYKKYKTQVADGMITRCEKALGISIKPYIEEIEIALPPTFSRYLNTPFGSPYGYQLDMWDSMLPRTIQFGKDQPFDNFLFCGASQERGDGYGSAYFSGEKAAGKIIKKIREGK